MSIIRKYPFSLSDVCGNKEWHRGKNVCCGCCANERCERDFLPFLATSPLRSTVSCTMVLGYFWGGAFDKQQANEERSTVMEQGLGLYDCTLTPWPSVLFYNGRFEIFFNNFRASGAVWVKFQQKFSSRSSILKKFVQVFPLDLILKMCFGTFSDKFST